MISDKILSFLLFKFSILEEQSLIASLYFSLLYPDDVALLPMIKYLESFGVQFEYGVKVENVTFDISGGRKAATGIEVIRNGAEETIPMTENDLVFITNGGCVENSAIGSQNTPSEFNKEIKPGGGWDMWRKIAAQDKSFGSVYAFRVRTDFKTAKRRITPCFRGFPARGK